MNIKKDPRDHEIFVVKIPVIEWTSQRAGITRPIMEFMDCMSDSEARQRFIDWLRHENSFNINR